MLHSQAICELSHGIHCLLPVDGFVGYAYPVNSGNPYG